MQSRSPIPVRPSYPQRGPQHLQRACFAVLQATAGDGASRDPAAIARHLYGDDGEPAALLLQRAAVAGATTTAAGWAKELVESAVADFLAGLAPSSAAAELMKLAVVIPLADESSEIKVPFATTTPLGGYIGEGLPIPSAAAPLQAATLTPRKAGIAMMLSRELARAAAGEQMVRQLLAESAALTLDHLLFDTSAPGLLAGVTPTPPSTGGPLWDLAALAEAVSGSGPCVFVAGRATATHLGVRADHKAIVFPSGGVPANRLIALAPQAVIFAAFEGIEIDSTEEAAWVMSDAPAQIGVPGSPPVAGAPAISSFQTGNLILRLLLTAGWAKRSDTAVAYTDTTWTPSP